MLAPLSNIKAWAMRCNCSRMAKAWQWWAKPVSRLATKTSRILAGFLAFLLVFGVGIYGAIRFVVPDAANAPVVTDAFDVQAVRSFKISSLTYAYSDFIYDPDAIELPVVKANLPNA